MMESTERGQVITFYSYKGGTGRTMALANVACLLAKRADSDKGILMIDWDLEAPGLHKFFRNHFRNQFTKDGDPDSALKESPGLIELFQEFDRATRMPEFSDASADEESVRALLEQVKPEEYILKTDIPQLYLLKAGRLDDSYSSKINTFDWENFYQRAPAVFRLFAERLAQRFQYVLIDSRTGLNDTSGICAMLMPEKLVTVFTPNRQSIEGALDLVRRATNYRSQSDDLRPLIVFPLPSRIDGSEQKLRDEWRFGEPDQKLIGYEPLFQDLFRSAYNLSRYQLTSYFNEVGIQHVPRYSYGEEVAALIEVSPLQSSPDRFSITRSYEIFVQWLIRSTGPWNEKDLPISSNSEPTVKSPTAPPNLIVLRNFGKRLAVVFVHGFGGDPIGTWGKFPDFLANDKNLDEWDIFSLGYHNKLNVFEFGIWKTTPPISSLADLLRTTASVPPLSKYEKLALLAHSTGGLVVQRAIVDDDEFAKRIRDVFLFATPSTGLRKAFYFRLINKSAHEMASNSDFIKDLRNRWEQKFGQAMPFGLRAIAGDTDEFVPHSSSLDPFPLQCRAVVPGNHLQVVKPETETALAVQVVVQCLIGSPSTDDLSNTAGIAFESGDFNRAIRLLEPQKTDLNASDLSILAISLEMVGRREEAARILEVDNYNGLEMRGMLAGRFKRRWVTERRDADAVRAEELYNEGFSMAEEMKEPAQAIYFGINVAFMNLAFRKDPDRTRDMAMKVLTYCQSAPRDVSRLAVEAEANLFLGNKETAIACYEEAAKMATTSRVSDSIYQQGVLVASLLEDEATAAQLERIFRGDRS